MLRRLRGVRRCRCRQVVTAERHLYGDRDPVLETSKLPNSAGDRWFESIFLQPRVINELSPGGTAIVPRPHYDAHGASAECTDLFELAVYRPGTALESGLIAYHRAALLSDVSEEERSPGKLQELGLEIERGDTWHRTPGKMETK